MLEVIVRAIALVLNIVMGFIIKKIGWVKKEDFSIFSKLVLRITLPCAIITSFNQVEIASSMIIYVIIGIIINLILGGAGYILGRGKGRNEQAFNILNYGSFNIGAFTLPYISSFLGASGVVIASLFDVGNSISAAGINYSIAKSVADKENKLTVKRVIKNMFSSIIFMTYLIMFIMRLFDFVLPSPIITFTSIVGQSNTFLAMLMIGIAFEIKIERSKIQKSVFNLGVRYIIAIIFSLLTYFLLPVSSIGKKVLTIMFFAPIAAMTTGFTQEINSDVESSSFMTSLSIVIGIIIITLLLVI